MTDRPLAGKVAIVTGAGRGIGRAIAIAYAGAGAAVCCAARTAAEIADTAQTITAAGGQALAVRTDVTCLAEVEAMVQAAVRAFGGLDILVINAGSNEERRPVAESDPTAWRATLDVYLVGAYYCARAAIPHLVARGAGKIITMGSGLGHHPRAGGSAYACAKAGLWALTQTLAQELWPHRISVNELIPGPVRTSATAGIAASGQSVFGIDSEWVKMPDDVAPLALFLATQPDEGPTAQSFSLMRRAT